MIGPEQTLATSPHMVGLYTGFAYPTPTHTMVLIDNAINSTAYLPNWTVTTAGLNECMLLLEVIE